MTQSGYCPRGPFCAFAHVEQEIRVVEDTSASPQSLVGSFNQITNDSTVASVSELIKQGNENLLNEPIASVESSISLSNGLPWCNSNFGNLNPEVSQTLAQTSFGINNNMNLPGCPSPLSKQIGNPRGFGNAVPYSKAPGSERTSINDQSILNSSHAFGSVGSNSAWQPLAPGANVIGSFSSRSSSPSMLPRQINSLNSDAQPFYPADETVDSVVDSALKDQDDPKLSDGINDKGLSSHIWPSTRTSHPESSLSSSLFAMSDPVNIPQEQTIKNNFQHGLGGRISLSPGLGPMEFPSAGSMPSAPYFPMHQSSSAVGSVGHAGLSSSFGSGIAISDFEKMQNKCKQWEESWNQAKAACDAWKKEATDANERARLSEDRCRQALERYQVLETKLFSNNASGDSDKKCPFLHQQYEIEDLRKFSVSNLKQLQNKYKADLEIVEKLIWEMLWKPQQKN